MPKIKVLKNLDKNPRGRPANLNNPEILIKIQQAFAIGCTDEEACAYAKISKSALYDYQSQHPDFLEEKERLKKEPILKAKHTIVKSLDDAKNAQWYLERKSKDEFSLRSELTGKDGKDLPIPLLQGVINVPDNNSSEKAE